MRAPPDDEAVIRDALTGAFDRCHTCRACVSYCGAFPLMFDLIHGPVERAEPRSAGDLTPNDQDRIVDACTRCGACVAVCRYDVDVPALADRALAMRRATGQLPLRRRLREWLDQGNRR